MSNWFQGFHIISIDTSWLYWDTLALVCVCTKTKCFFSADSCTVPQRIKWPAPINLHSRNALIKHTADLYTRDVSLCSFSCTSMSCAAICSVFHFISSDSVFIITICSHRELSTRWTETSEKTNYFWKG